MSARTLDMRRVQLTKGVNGFGLQLIGGGLDDNVEEKVFVKLIVEGGSAAGTKLRAGDRIVSINGSRGLSMQAVLGILTNTDTITLDVYADEDRMSQMIELYAEDNASGDEVNGNLVWSSPVVPSRPRLLLATSLLHRAPRSQTDY